MPGVTVNGLGSASRKRSRRTVDDEEADESEEILDVQSARSSLRHDPSSKRPRVSGASSSSKRRSVSFRDETPLTESDDADMEEDHAPDSPPATQYETMRDAGFEHLQHAVEDDMQATQRIRSRPVNQLGENHTADCGILESITCVNFMCHERLHCELGPLLNFIVGENGSGKSAVLTAITLCLGGKASATNRGGSLKSFVKEGKDQAALIVKIKNQGSDAYQRDVFGDSITVERHFSRAGSSGFKLKSETGRIISTKKSEVDEIVEFFALQVDNPLNVLSQDNARQFLNAASASQKYKFFIEGVQLEQLDRDYRLVHEYLDSNEARLHDLAELRDNAEKAFNKAEKLRQVIQQNEELRRKKRLYISQLTWAQVIEQERLLEERERTIREATAKIAGAEQVAEVKAQAYEREDERVRRAEGAVEAVREEGGEKESQVEAAAAAFNSARKQLEELHTDERDAYQRLKVSKINVQSIEEKIRDEEKRVEAVNGGESARIQEEVTSARAREAEIDEKLRQANEFTPQYDQKIMAASDEMKQAAAAVEQKRNEIGSVEQRISSLERGRGSPYDAYEPQVSSLLRLIDNDGAFTRKPVGPIGAKIRLLKPQWSSIIEKTLGNNLNSFIVTNTADQRRLRDLMKRTGVKNCPILIGSGREINTEGKEPDPQFDTILRVLKFDEPIVRDQLIITNAIEQVLLIARRTDAEKIMFDGPPPRNVQACLCLHDTKRNEGLRLTNRAGGNNVATSPVIPNPGQKARMQTDVDMQINLHRDTLEQLSKEYHELQGEQRRAQQAVQRGRAEANEHQKAIKRLEKSLTDVRIAIDRLLADLDKFDGVDGRLEQLRAQLETAETEQDHHGDQYGDIRLKKQDQNKIVEERKKELTAVKLDMKDYENRVRKAEDKLARCQETRRIALVEKNDSIDEITQCRQDRARAEEKRDQQARHVEDFTRQATEAQPERVAIPEGETYASIEKKFEAVNRQLEERARRHGMSDEEINDRAFAAAKRLDEANRGVEGTRQTIQSLKASLTMRQTKWRSFQRYISSFSRVNFIYLLSERGFRGQLLLDHKNKKLQVQVEPDVTRKNASGRNTKTLSGGEKSFSSICLLLAIWEAMGSPLRCLDEFDVFMDNVNRAISTNMLISAARRSVSRQYIMITPNAIEGRAKLDKDVKIIRLTDPRQRTLTDL